jgi:hypothetical protein
MSKMKRLLTIVAIVTEYIFANLSKPAIKSIVLGAQKNVIIEGVPDGVSYDISAIGIDLGNAITMEWYDAAEEGSDIPEPEGVENFGYIDSSGQFFIILWDNSTAGDYYFTVTCGEAISNRAKLTVGCAKPIIIQ